MAKKTAKQTKKSVKNTSKKGKTTKSATANVSKRSLIQRLRDLRQERAERKVEIKRHKQTDEARKVKAEKQAVREKALQQVNEAVIKSKKRRSYPGLTLLALIVVAGLGGALVWQYRQAEVDDKQVQIDSLQTEITTFTSERASLEAARKAEEDRFQNYQLDNAMIRVPREWQQKASQYPDEEQVLGDDNVTIRVISSPSRDSVEEFLPIVDYIWVAESDQNKTSITSKSLHCDRFDTLDNDLNKSVREHKDFLVYCDDDPEQVTIAVLSTPTKYGFAQSDAYFMVTIRDIQQFNLDELVNYIESYTTQ